MLTYEFLVGKPPFEAESNNETYRRITKVLTLPTSRSEIIFPVQVDLRFPAHLSTEAKDLISRLLRKESSDRLNLEGVAAHPWITKWVAARS